MPPIIDQDRIRINGRLELAIAAYNNAKFKSIRAAAKAFDANLLTLSRRLRGAGPTSESQQNNQNLRNHEEIALTRWILDLADRGHPVRFSHIEYMANQLLSARRGSGWKMGKRWTKRFVARTPKLRTQRYRKYDYERALCEDPPMIQKRFNSIRNAISKYGIPPSDIWNFDESRLQWGYWVRHDCYWSQFDKQADQYPGRESRMDDYNRRYQHRRCCSTADDYIRKASCIRRLGIIPNCLILIGR